MKCRTVIMTFSSSTEVMVPPVVGLSHIHSCCAPPVAGASMTPVPSDTAAHAYSCCCAACVPARLPSISLARVRDATKVYGICCGFPLSGFLATWWPIDVDEATSNYEGQRAAAALRRVAATSQKNSAAFELMVRRHANRVPLKIPDQPDGMLFVDTTTHLVEPGYATVQPHVYRSGRSRSRSRGERLPALELV